MSNNEIKLVCFDLGGVVIRICHTWKEACDRAGLPYYIQADCIALKQARETIINAHMRGEYEDGTFFQRLAERSAGCYTAEDIRRIHEAWLIDVFPGMEDTVAEINKLPTVETACLSNTNAEHWRQMFHLDENDNPLPGETPYPVMRLFNHPHCSHLLKATKPGETIYRRFEEMTGYSGGEILYFDDLPENTDAARRMGWRAELIELDGNPADQIREHLHRYGVLKREANL